MLQELTLNIIRDLTSEGSTLVRHRPLHSEEIRKLQLKTCKNMIFFFYILDM